VRPPTARGGGATIVRRGERTSNGDHAARIGYQQLLETNLRMGPPDVRKERAAPTA
jgi:hypothetical protein